MDRGRLTPEQKARIEEIKGAGGIAEVVRDLYYIAESLVRTARLRYGEIEACLPYDS